MSTIDLTQNNDGRLVEFEGYDHNRRMGTFTGSWGDPTKTGGQNTWSHLGIYCGQQLGPDVPDTERRLVYLGLLIAYINGDRCAHWSEAQKEAAIQTAWEHINANR